MEDAVGVVEVAAQVEEDAGAAEEAEDGARVQQRQGNVAEGDAEGAVVCADGLLDPATGLRGEEAIEIQPVGHVYGSTPCRGSTRQVRGVQTQQADSGLVILNDREHTVIFMFLRKLLPDEVSRRTHGIVVVSGHIQPILPGNGLLRLPESTILVPLRLDTLREETRLIAHHHIARHNHAIWTDCRQNRRSKETEILLIGRMALSRMQVTDLQQCDGLAYVVTVCKEKAPFTVNSRIRSSMLIRE